MQFAVNRETGEIVVIEMNPRVSRSSALASKATGYPIAKVATKLAIGYTLDEIPNDITRHDAGLASSRRIDYVVVKAPRFAFEKFPGSDETLTTQMKSVGEAMGIGRSFTEAYGKAHALARARRAAARAGPVDAPLWDRFDALLGAPARGRGRPRRSSAETGVHPWFCHELARMVARRGGAGRGRRSAASTPRRCGARKRHGLARRAPRRRGSARPRPRCASRAPRCRRAPRLQDGRLVRRRGRGARRPTSTRATTDDRRAARRRPAQPC